MEREEYVENVTEQLLAFGFEELESEQQSGFTVHSKQSSRLIPILSREEIVLITRLDGQDVNAVETAIENARNLLDNITEDSSSKLQSRLCYLLIVAASTTKPMSIRAKRGVGSNLNAGGFMLPILVDLEEGGLIYDRPSRISRFTKHRTASNHAEKYFRL